VLAAISAAPAGLPTSWKGDFRARAGESLAALSLDNLDQIPNFMIGTYWTTAVVEGAIHRMEQVQVQVRRFLPLHDEALTHPGEVELTILDAVIGEAYA
jgi:hypothetical protein